MKNNKPNQKNSSLLVNGEQFLAMRNLLDQQRAEIDILKKAVNMQQAVLFEIGNDMKSMMQQFQLLRDYVDKKIVGGKRK